ncbi:hypothetical protein [Lysobacter sp. GCM10012299]|uniref:hypothetical protein n=1 Tax=Lysobacter sp. GCM10012299 TaxID=3317333 RepID=UPI0036211C40
MDFLRIFKHESGRSKQSRFTVPALTNLLTQHGFNYVGFIAETDTMRGTENHRFSNGHVTFNFGFAYSIYGEDLITLEDSTGKTGGAYLSYYVDYACLRNSYRDAGLSHDEALANALQGHVDDVVALYRFVRSQGRTIPLKADRERMAAAGR